MKSKSLIKFSLLGIDSRVVPYVLMALRWGNTQTILNLKKCGVKKYNYLHFHGAFGSKIRFHHILNAFSSRNIDSQSLGGAGYLGFWI